MGKLLKSKTFWGGIGSIVSGVSVIATTGDYPSGIQLVVLGVLAIFGRDAIRKVEY